MSVGPRPFPQGRRNEDGSDPRATMTYEDYVCFMLSEEDRGNDYSLRFGRGRTHWPHDPNCDYRSTNSTNLHKMIHTGQKDHACDFPGCDMSFSSSSHLTRHEETH
ncbi:Putative C2H2 zinc finger protein [Ectocarpus siliculosus]|uniref:C2H2 zinc finger protein n=1 Tax=Ectocarpus siliculosus TaxID=2880 RepID=D8LK08_ECTSI|nr:Putative C2H2 zinc finger protein [Ectocarpus siliculosus]|eukprot:CBN74477.1 Putative C2H2 zinc finger protein [Ectocarpus siliculosus]